MSEIERIPAEKARKEFSRIVDEAGYSNTTRIITKNGHDRAVIMSPEEYRHFVALEDYLDGMVAEQAYADYLAHGGESWEEVKKQLGMG